MTDDDRRLSEIHTLWSVVRQAHDDDAEAARDAQRRLLAEYGGAARRYLLAALKTEDAADEAFQEFSLRFVRGDFKHVCPERGRFRSFLKTCLYHLIVDQQRRRKKMMTGDMGVAEQVAVAPAAPDCEADAAFLRSWRDDLLSRAWQRLCEDEQRSGKPYHTVLRTRAEQPAASSTELAAIVSGKLNREITPANMRVLVHRARELFATFLLRAVTDSLSESRRELIEEELIELQLLDYCRAALDQEAHS